MRRPVIAMGLRAMGIGDEIVNLAFGLVLGAVAVAAALAFGLGGREAAGQVTQRSARQYVERKPPTQPWFESGTVNGGERSPPFSFGPRQAAA